MFNLLANCLTGGATPADVAVSIRLKGPGLEMQVRSLFTISNHTEVSGIELGKAVFTYLSVEKKRKKKQYNGVCYNEK